jgi:hypothetical protein
VGNPVADFPIEVSEMPSPFPGMDPYLEMHWRDVHTRLMLYAADAIQDRLPGDLIARVEEGVSIDLGDDLRGAAPDVQIVEEPRSIPKVGEPAESTLAVAEPLVIPVSLPHTDRHITILDAGSGNRVVTAIEFLSPTNKIPGTGRDRYLRKQQDYLDGGVNLVEVDLIRAGIFTLAVPEWGINQHFRTDYQICVRRQMRPEEAEVYRAPLRERLPIIRIPLRPKDKDIPLDLQDLIDQCYRRGRYAAINYRSDPIPPLSLPDARWADDLLRAAGLRQFEEGKDPSNGS